MPSYVLGLSSFYHDAAACLLRDGEIVLAIEEERLSRLKHDRRYPARAVAACLDAAGIGPGDVDAVVFYEKTLPKLERQIETWSLGFPRSFSAFVRSMSRYLDGRLDLARWLQRKGGFRGEILFSEHHLSHAAFAFHSSPFDEAVVLVADGVGEWATTSVWSAGPQGIAPLREIRFPDSLGLFYSQVTAHLGFRVNEDEYKVMGLAAYGKDSFAREMDSLLHLDAGGAFRSGSKLVSLLGPARVPVAPIEDRHRDLAHSAQVRLEEALLAIEASLPKGLPLCMAGGVALNGAANARLAERRQLFVPFAPGDSGAAIGAAYVGWRAIRPSDVAWPRHSSVRRSTTPPAPRPRRRAVSSRVRWTPTETRRLRRRLRQGPSSGGSTVAWSSVRARWAVVRSWPTRGARRCATWSTRESSTGSHSGRSRPRSPRSSSRTTSSARGRCRG